MRQSHKTPGQHCRGYTRRRAVRHFNNRCKEIGLTSAIEDLRCWLNVLFRVFHSYLPAVAGVELSTSGLILPASLETAWQEPTPANKHRGILPSDETINQALAKLEIACTNAGANKPGSTELFQFCVCAWETIVSILREYNHTRKAHAIALQWFGAELARLHKRLVATTPEHPKSPIVIRSLYTTEINAAKTWADPEDPTIHRHDCLYRVAVTADAYNTIPGDLFNLYVRDSGQCDHDAVGIVHLNKKVNGRTKCVYDHDKRPRRQRSKKKGRGKGTKKPRISGLTPEHYRALLNSVLRPGDTIHDYIEHAFRAPAEARRLREQRTRAKEQKSATLRLECDEGEKPYRTRIAELSSFLDHHLKGVGVRTKGKGGYRLRGAIAVGIVTEQVIYPAQQDPSPKFSDIFWHTSPPEEDEGTNE